MLALKCLSGQDGVAGDLRARAGGGGHGDPGRGLAGDLPPLADDLHVVEGRPAVGEQAGDGLGRVDGAAAAEADDHVAAAGAGRGEGGVDLRDGRLAALADERRLDAGLGEQLGEAVGRAAVPAVARVADDQRRLAQPGGQLRGADRRAAPEDHPRDAEQLEAPRARAARPGHQPCPSPKKMLWCLTPWRRWAIQSATVSRQRR